jgi:hypothetical protein
VAVVLQREASGSGPRTPQPRGLYRGGQRGGQRGADVWIAQRVL